MQRSWHTRFGHGCMVNVVGFESHTVSVPTIHFATVVWPRFVGTLFTNKGRLDLAGRLQLARLSKCVVPGREVQRQLRTQTCRFHLDLSFSNAGKRQGKGVTFPVLRQLKGLAPHSLPDPSPFFFPPSIFFLSPFPLNSSHLRGLSV